MFYICASLGACLSDYIYMIFLPGVTNESLKFVQLGLTPFFIFSTPSRSDE